MSVRRLVTAVAATVVLTSCGTSTSSSSPGGSPSGPVASPPHTIASGSATIDPSPSTSPVGSPRHPLVVTARQQLLDWAAVPGSTKDLVTVGDRWTLTVTAGGATARLVGPQSRVVTIRAGDHSRITDAFLDAHHALVVSEDRLAQAPDRATLVDLASGHESILDGRSDPPTVVGGTWALGPDSLVHATSGSHHRYCLATVDLASGEGTTGWCAPPRHGFRSAAVTTDGTSLMTFDAHHPSCRTLNVVYGRELTSFPGVTDCKGWDATVLDGSSVWSVVPNDHRIDVAHFYAHTNDGWYDLGPGTSGSLVACDGAAYFTRDPQTSTDPATLMRWSPDTASLSIAYASKGNGNAFLAPPRCGGTHLTVTSYAQAGDEQVTTNLE
ncbi:hypothetical protein [Nocardioides sp.]|uniref:hypothetical protein n=1 Tax=Nocardioides sp. TaxID=35761 RepID=UPI002F3ED73E